MSGGHITRCFWHRIFLLNSLIITPLHSRLLIAIDFEVTRSKIRSQIILDSLQWAPYWVSIMMIQFIGNFLEGQYSEVEGQLLWRPKLVYLDILTIWPGQSSQYVKDNAPKIGNIALCPVDISKRQSMELNWFYNGTNHWTWNNV